MFQKLEKKTEDRRQKIEEGGWGDEVYLAFLVLYCVSPISSIIFRNL
jgi:hypothetical protein